MECAGCSPLRAFVCPARRGPLEGPNFPSEYRDLPYLAGIEVKIAIVKQNCAKLGKSQSLQPKIGPFSSRVRAGCAQGRRSHFDVRPCILATENAARAVRGGVLTGDSKPTSKAA